MRRYLPIILAVITAFPLFRIGFAAPGDIFYLEDFSQTEIGYLPSGWSGGHNSMVKEDRGQKMLVLFQGNDDSVVISNVRLPTNWQIDFVVRFSGNLSSRFGLMIGNARVLIHSTEGVILNQSKAPCGDLRGMMATLSLRKEGPIYKVSINGKEAVVARDTRVVTANSVTFRIDRGMDGPVRSDVDSALHSIKGREL